MRPYADPRRQRPAGLLVLGIAAVLVLSSVSWFAGDRAPVGVTQLVVGLVLAGLGGLLLRRAARR